MFPKQNVSSVRTARFRARDLGESLADPEPTLRAANHLNQGSWNFVALEGVFVGLFL